MNNIESEFFNEFKKLDKLCKEIYGPSMENKLGVTLYIDDMSQKDYQGRYVISGWTSDYTKLTRIRNIRNKMAHSTDETSYSVGEEDVRFVRLFYNRILNQTDPIALLRKKKQSTGQTVPQAPQVHAQQTLRSAPSRTSTTRPNSGCLTVIALFIAVVAFVISFLL